MTETENRGGPLQATLSQEGHGILNFSPRPGVCVFEKPHMALGYETQLMDIDAPGRREK